MRAHRLMVTTVIFHDRRTRNTKAPRPCTASTRQPKGSAILLAHAATAVCGSEGTREQTLGAKSKEAPRHVFHWSRRPGAVTVFPRGEAVSLPVACCAG